GDLFRFHSLKLGETPHLDDPRLRAAVKNRVLFLDAYFDVSGVANEKDAEGHRQFFNNCRYLIEQCGCRAVDVIHHATKAGSAEEAPIDWTTFVRGNSAIFGKLDASWAAQYWSKKGRVFVKCIK